MDKNRSSDESSRAKSKFLSDMSHEIHNSMKAVITQNDMLRQTDLSAKQIEYVDAIYNSARKLSWVVNDILDFSQLELGKVQLQSINFNLEYLINDIFRKTVEQKKDHPVETYIDIGKDVPRDLVGDPTRLRQVLVNLLSNAFRFTLKGEIGVIVKDITDKTDALGDANRVKLQITVKDSGKGIAKNEMDTIFGIQSGSTPSQSWEYGGTGLGLAICKLVVEAMGGTIKVESKEGAGSSFVIVLEFTKGVLHQGRNVYPLTREELAGKKAIIVDDNEVARKILKKCCETMGIEPILISASPKAVLQMLSDLSDDGEIPDLILCDIMMPEMDGYELISKIHSDDRFKNVKSIAVTSAVHVGSAQNAQECGFNGFLPKPVFLDELAKVITTVLGDEREHKTIVTRHMAEELKFKGTKVLVVEANASNQKLIEECLNMMGCEKELVVTGREAISRIEEKIYDICLIDIDVYKGEGAEVVRTMKEIGHHMPIVVLLAEGMEKYRTECLDAGADDFIVKPVDLVSLKRIVQRYGKT